MAITSHETTWGEGRGREGETGSEPQRSGVQQLGGVEFAAGGLNRT